LTIEAPERIDAVGNVLRPLDETELRRRLGRLKNRQVEAITVVLFNAYIDGRHEERVRAIVEEELPSVPVSISSEVLPEMQEYERAQTTVVNSYVGPVVTTYLRNLSGSLDRQRVRGGLHILRSDGGLSGAVQAGRFPVNLLMSGPAGGVSGALWISRQSGYDNLLTLDMGGTSTDVALIEGGKPKVRRETSVGDLTVRASCLDVRTVGAGGGSIAHVPELTRALRVGPESAGAEPGPAFYGKGGTRPTVSDANAVLGYLPGVRLAGEVALDYGAAEKAIQTIADALGIDLKRAARGIVEIVNETMFGALRSVSIQQGYDPRDFALFAFGGAGPLHANALARLMHSWPVIIPPAPGVLCAYGDATTRLRNEASRTLIRPIVDVAKDELLACLNELAGKASGALEKEGVNAPDQTVRFEADCRYEGQGLTLTVAIPSDRLRAEGIAVLADAFDAEHRKVFTFHLDEPREIVNLRAIVEAPSLSMETLNVPEVSDPDPHTAEVGASLIHVDGRDVTARIYDRDGLGAGHRLLGPAIVREMDSTTLILPGHAAVVDRTGCLIIRPSDN
jgi:N-methylhydantoinase A